MLPEDVRLDNLTLPKNWTSQIKAALVQSIAFAFNALTHALGQAENCTNPGLRFAAEAGRWRTEASLLQEQLALIMTRFSRIPPLKRPRYIGTERHRILLLKAARGWSQAQTAAAMLVTKWLMTDIGGLAQMEAQNRAKAKLLYEAIDSSGGFYAGHAQPACRSFMNVTFRLPSDELTDKFVKGAKERGMTDLKGHRSVGGIRASIYNAMPVAGVEALRDFMTEFREQNGR